MKRNSTPWWKLAPALLLTGMTWSGLAAADDAAGPGKFDGPGGMSAPADPDRGDRAGRAGERWRKGGAPGKRAGRAALRGRLGRHGRMGARMGARHRDVMAKLDLSERQQERIRDIRQAQERRMIPLQANLKEAALDLRQLMQEDKPSPSRIDAAVDRLADLRAEAQKARLASRLEIRSVLTEAQRKTLGEMKGGMGRGIHGRRRGLRGDG